MVLRGSTRQAIGLQIAADRWIHEFQIHRRLMFRMALRAGRGRHYACNSRPTVKSTQISDSPKLTFSAHVRAVWRTMSMSKSENPKRNCFSLEEFCFRNGIGRTTAYKEIKEGRL